MKRYYLSKIKLVTDPNLGQVYRHRLQEIPGVWYEGGEIASDPITGIPTHPALLVLVGSADHKKFRDDPELIGLPQVVPDVKLSAVHTQTKMRAMDEIKALGFAPQEVDTVFSGADGFRDVLNHFGRKNNPDFDVDKFDLDDAG